MLIYTKDLSLEDDFSALCLAGLKNKGLSENSEYKKRLEYEISVIKEKGYAKLLLGLREFVKSIKKYEITSFINGSLAAWVLGITHFDPIKHDLIFDPVKYGLIFELFINPLRCGIGYVYIKCEEISKNHFTVSSLNDDKERICEICAMSYDEMLASKDKLLIYENSDIFLDCSIEYGEVLGDFSVDVDKMELENALKIVGGRYFDTLEHKDFYLGDTRLLFSEQIIEALTSISGCELGFADIWRRAMSKNTSEILENEFFSTCADKQKAREVLDILKEFSKCSLHKAFFLYEALSLCSNQGQAREQK